MPKVSVIVPIYNVERFMARCAESLMQQTLQDVEYIFVDDASPDGSVQVLREVIGKHPERKGLVKILRHDTNKGLPAARNTGLAAASGDYIFHCDSDDFVEINMLEVLYGKAVENGADIVWCDWYLTFGQNERYMKQPMFGSPIEALKAMLAGQMKFNVWNKLVCRSIYVGNGIDFPAGHGMGEDMTMMLLFAKAKKVTYVPQAFYHYVKTNATALTQSFSSRHLESLKYNVARVERSLREDFGHGLDLEIACLKLEAKFPFLIMGADKKMYRLWQSTYPDANAYILKNKYISSRSRFVQWCASKGLWAIVRLHYYVVCRLVYGVIYK